ncbi:MAG: hypothetical protein IKQ36_10895 [Clostridia bacterium]|nr:hypothetical protein [Clostridia bacterium]
MKKLLTAILVLAMVIAFIGCGSKPAGDNPGGNQNDPAGAADGGNGANTETPAVGFTKDGESIIFTVDPSIKLVENSWLGIVPAGVEYRNEADADEADIFWAYPENMDKKPGDKYIFRVGTEDVAGIEDGNYSMVLCDNDDEGKVILQFPITIKGSELTADFSKIKIY